MTTKVYDHLGDWLGVLISARAENRTLTPANDSQTRSVGFAVGSEHHVVRLTTVYYQQEWFQTEEERDRILGRLGLDFGDLAEMLHSSMGIQQLLTLPLKG